ncbi:MAG: hypothetical protein H6582_00985 [Crocinitomicaceae bacterium]|nr:hypothetical protein [Crocinitomicaceae bacterium]
MKTDNFLTKILKGLRNGSDMDRIIAGIFVHTSKFLFAGQFTLGILGLIGVLVGREFLTEQNILMLIVSICLVGFFFWRTGKFIDRKTDKPIKKNLTYGFTKAFLLYLLMTVLILSPTIIWMIITLSQE